jgi:hypothetical protein
MIKFISHESFPDDQYTKEVVYLSIEPQTCLAYVRKPMRNGGFFWSTISSSVMKNGEKKFIQGVEIDSNILKKEILAFLEDRSWEKQKVAPKYSSNNDLQTIQRPQIPPQMSFLDDCPF